MKVHMGIQNQFFASEDYLMFIAENLKISDCRLNLLLMTVI
jgi:hypothetical protein